MKELEQIYGITIDNSDLFVCALTHPSYTQENNLPYDKNYERFEFLGAQLLFLIIHFFKSQKKSGCVN